MCPRSLLHCGIFQYRRALLPEEKSTDKGPTDIRRTSQRLSPVSTHILRNRECRDGTPNCKGPPLAGLSSGVRDILPERRTAWLATQWVSRRSPSKFPANREFFREFAELPGPNNLGSARNAGFAEVSSRIPYSN
jgi:hypothetical protein